MPSAPKARSVGPVIEMPAPYTRHCGSRSIRSTAMPFFLSVMAVDMPAMPPPTINALRVDEVSMVFEKWVQESGRAARIGNP